MSVVLALPPIYYGAVSELLPAVTMPLLLSSLGASAARVVLSMVVLPPPISVGPVSAVLPLVNLPWPPFLIGV